MAQEITMGPRPELSEEQKAKQLQARFDAHVRIWKSENEYTPAWLPENWRELLDMCLRHWHDAALRMPSIQYKAMATRDDGKYTYEQFDVILQILFMASAHQLEMSMDEWWGWRENFYDRLREDYGNSCDLMAPDIQAEFDGINAASSQEPTEA